MALPLGPKGIFPFGAHGYSLQCFLNGGSICLGAEGLSSAFEEIVVDLHRRSSDHMYSLSH
jgi:hypothetical protein